MSNEYYAVILEFSSREIKLGFVGDSSEHTRVTPESPLWKKFVPASKSTSTSPAFLQVDSHAIPVDLKDELLQSFNCLSPYQDVLSAYEADRNALKWYDWELDEYVTLSIIVRVLLSTRLLISPLKTKIFVIDSEFSAANKATLCKTFLGMKTAVTITYLPFSPCCCIGAGVENALVVSLDWSSCKVVPVLDLRSLPAREYVQFSGESIHYSPAIRHNSKTFEEIESDILSNDTIMEKAFFIENCLPAAIAGFVKSLDLDSRTCVAENIIFTGVRSHIPGIKGRLLTEIANFLQGYDVSGKVCLGAWAGASLYCSTTLLKIKGSEWKHMEVSKVNLEKNATGALETYRT
ncbi:hypothetical protein JCM33374_g98 [Metschnikowia sp. JCM 33374]|nr:hypothetical protein JCM33374_g98 [Metschnikowia sp. JCM 33374]